MQWLRSLLTALGIIFGVAAVIAMLAVGRGAQQEILNQMKLVGVNNIVIQQIQVNNNEEEESGSGAKEANKSLSMGLHLEDARAIEAVLPNLKTVSPEVLYPSYALYGKRRFDANLVGVRNSFFEVFNLQLARGRTFGEMHHERGDPVCIVGHELAAKLFSEDEPIGRKLKAGGIWLTVIGVLRNRPNAGGASDLGIRDYNKEVFIPIQTALLRRNNRALITEARIKQMARTSNQSDDDANLQVKNIAFNQLDRIVVQMEDNANLSASGKVLDRILLRRHKEARDFNISIPELLLKQQQRTNDIFNLVLGVIAGISLLVGGIGIMNIMLASVWERIREIGTRQALGATRMDITFQFLAEAIIISLSGGIVGIILGYAGSYTISILAKIPTIVTFFSVALSFFVAAGIGLIFGWMPARKAANQNPIESLRYE